jgi:hypothetical protein
MKKLKAKKTAKKSKCLLRFSGINEKGFVSFVIPAEAGIHLFDFGQENCV